MHLYNHILIHSYTRTPINPYTFLRDTLELIISLYTFIPSHSFFHVYYTHFSHSPYRICLFIAIDHDAKKKKITNSGAVSFTVHAGVMDDGSTQYRVDPATVQSIYGGFTMK